MDVKRVAFETRPVSAKTTAKPAALPTVERPKRPTIKREEVAAIVDRFLSQKMAAQPAPQRVEPPQILPSPQTDTSPVKTIIHEFRTVRSNGNKPTPVDFVSEDDVRKALREGERIYITAKTIITPAARDLGEEKEIFSKI